MALPGSHRSENPHIKYSAFRFAALCGLLLCMWCEQVIRNLGDQSDIAGRGIAVDWVDIQWNQRSCWLKKKTRSGIEIQICLPRGQTLQHQDVIHEDAGQIVAVHLLECDVIVASPEPGKIANLALELGNLHLPVEIDGPHLVFVEDADAMVALDHMQIRWTRASRRFAPVEIISTQRVNFAPDYNIVIRSRVPRNSASNA